MAWLDAGRARSRRLPRCVSTPTSALRVSSEYTADPATSASRTAQSEYASKWRTWNASRSRRWRLGLAWSRRWTRRECRTRRGCCLNESLCCSLFPSTQIPHQAALRMSSWFRELTSYREESANARLQ